MSGAACARCGDVTRGEAPMTDGPSRRSVLAGSMASAALGLATSSGLARAADRPSITGVTWGGPWAAAWSDIAGRQSRVAVEWLLHEAATTAIVAKIKASWPNPPADFINASEPTLYALAGEDWLQPVEEAALANFAHLPARQFIRNQAG